MAHPETVKFSQAFQLHKVIHNKNGFSIGVGTYLGEGPWVLAMRWNGEDGKAGFPYTGKHPLWFSLPQNLTFSFLTGLLQSGEVEKEDYDKILNYLSDFK